MISEETRQAMVEWLMQATPPERQLDRRWIDRYRELTSQDSFWWLSWAGPFTAEEQKQWDHLFQPPIDDAAKERLGSLLMQSRERELAAALAEQREPRLHYPAIEIDDVRHRIVAFEQLDAEIEREERNEIVRQLYHGNIEDDINYLRIIEATCEGDRERFWTYNQCMFHEPTPEEMSFAFNWVRRLIQQGLERPETVEISRQLLSFIREQLQLSFVFSPEKDEPPVAIELDPKATPRTISVEAVKQFYETVLCEGGYEGWQVSIDTAGSGTRVEPAARRVVLGDTTWTVENARHLLSHELAGHVARAFAGEHSPLGLLGIGTKGYSATEEGLALYHEQQVASLHRELFDVSGPMSGMLATGMASGIITPPQPFSALYTFFNLLAFLHRRLLRPWNDRKRDQERAHQFALRRSLRTYRGVSDLSQAGICYLQDVVYLRGMMLIQQVVAEDETVLDRLAVGKVAYNLLPLLQPLHIIPPPQPLRQLAYAPEIDGYILSFESSEEGVVKPA